jgi:CheY-like chemotaxis protein
MKSEFNTNRILIADDDPTNLEVILDFLGDGEEEVLYAPNGKRACELAARELPDVIIMDWEMPVMNGIEAITQLRHDPLTADIPIIVATGVMTESDDLKTALESGAVDFIRKPFDPVEFKSRLGTTLRLSASYREIKDQKRQIEEMAAKEQELLNDSLQQKERELSTAAIFDYQKSELLTKLLDEIRRLDTVTNNRYAPEIRKIGREIKSYLDLDRSWSNFKLHFEEVHPGFLDKISESYQGLTSNELRVCAYLKIGLNNKEIATLTNVESASVRRALNRLKKKMNLTVEDGLREYIESL